MDKYSVYSGFREGDSTGQNYQLIGWGSRESSEAILTENTIRRKIRQFLAV